MGVKGVGWDLGGWSGVRKGQSNECDRECVLSASIEFRQRTRTDG